MIICWGYSPKVKKNIPLGDLTLDGYLKIAKQAMLNLGWRLSHTSKNSIIAYTPISLQSYGEEISLQVDNNIVTFKSECIGMQLLLNDYGKNTENVKRFLDEFGYAKVQVDENWNGDEAYITAQVYDIKKAPLTAKNKIKNLFYLLIPQKNYVVTPILIFLNVAYFAAYTLLTTVIYKHLSVKFPNSELLGYYVGANSREFVLNGQYWRLITHQFSHLSFLHLFFNMYALAYIGLMVENKLGSKKYVITYIISGICGGLLSLMYHDSGYMTGASGAIMGLFGAFLALLMSKAFDRNATMGLFVGTVVLLFLMLIGGTFKHNIDNAAHIGGLVWGFVSGYLLFKEKVFFAKIRYAVLACMVVIFTVVVLKFTPKIQTKEFEALEKKYKQNWVTYYSIFRLPETMATGKKLTIIQERGIDLWKRNDSLVNEMLALELSKEQRMKAEFHHKIVEIQSKMVALIYKECAESTKYYRREIRALTRELNALRMGQGKD